MPQLPVIPETIVVHLGPPDSDAPNITETFPNYIKNVASSEIYPTWPMESIKANVLAQISVALNRVYTQFYRNNGKNFDITSSPAYDQTYVYQRDIFDNISQIVDEIFDSYIRRIGAVEPLFAQFCDGIEVQCDGLSQWGSVELANAGLGYDEIIRNYYGDNVEIVRNVPVENFPLSSLESPLREGNTGRSVELAQIRLNRISRNYPGIPKIFPTDGFFGESTKRAVEKFQEVFGLTVDGIIGKATWSRINFIYNSVKKLYSLSSEGLLLSELETSYPGSLSIGDSGDEVSVVQYYLSYIALFVPSVIPLIVDGSFGPSTENAVRSYQRTYNLDESGIVDERTWNSIEQTYYGILSGIPYRFEEGIILPYPGRILRVGVQGDDVRALQEYLSYISITYTSIPAVTVDGIYGALTASAVKAFKNQFGLSGNPERVNANTWNAIIKIYDDLYEGNIVNDEQFPGYGLG